MGETRTPNVVNDETDGEKTQMRRRLLPFGIAVFFSSFHAAAALCRFSVRPQLAFGRARVRFPTTSLADDHDGGRSKGFFFFVFPTEILIASTSNSQVSP